jgi:hypothetical protein
MSLLSPLQGQQHAAPESTHFHPQLLHGYQGQGQQQRQPNYEVHEPSTLPEVVSPIYQLGQTSASPPEYDESAETAGHGSFAQQRYYGDEKQAASSQQHISRY